MFCVLRLFIILEFDDMLYYIWIVILISYYISFVFSFVGSVFIALII